MNYYTSEADELDEAKEEVEEKKKRKVFVVEVIDSGAGISLENQKKLFNSVVQFHANAQQAGGGSGLGLWISMSYSYYCMYADLLLCESKFRLFTVPLLSLTLIYCVMIR